MTMASRHFRAGRLLVACAGIVLSAACSKDVIPTTASSSDSSVQLSVQAVPSSIPRDGSSQSTIVIEALTADGRPARLVVLQVDIVVNGGTVELGTLSSTTVVTGDDGKARLTYTAPPKPTALPAAEAVVTVRVTASGGNLRADVSRQIDIRLLAAAATLSPPTADFSYSPTTPSAFQDIVFSAAKSTAAAGRQIVSYTWDFGGGGGGRSGKEIVKAFDAPGSYVVTLTVTDDAGEKSVTDKTVTVSALPGPTAVLSFSPTTPTTSTTVFFDATASTAPSLARITSYLFNYGDGASDGPSASPTQSHTFAATGVYVGSTDGDRQPGAHGNDHGQRARHRGLPDSGADVLSPGSEAGHYGVLRWQRIDHPIAGEDYLLCLQLRRRHGDPSRARRRIRQQLETSRSSAAESREPRGRHRFDWTRLKPYRRLVRSGANRWPPRARTPGYHGRFIGQFQHWRTPCVCC